MRTWKQLICGLLGTTLCAGLLGAVPAAAAMTTENATEDDSGISVDTSGDAAYDVFTYRGNDTGVGHRKAGKIAAIVERRLRQFCQRGGNVHLTQNCQVLETVSLPASCTTLGNYVFDGCQALTAFSVAPENPAYQEQDSVLFTADGETLLRYPQAKLQCCMYFRTASLPSLYTYSWSISFASLSLASDGV